MPAPLSSQLRIGAFSRRVGISAAVLRAWETRYGLFAPTRTTGGYRLYGPEEERRVNRMQAHIARGIAAAESAALVLADGAGGGACPALAEAWRTLDLVGAQYALDELLGGTEPEVVTAREILPLLRELPPERRHVAQQMLQLRLLGLAARWHDGTGPIAVVGCGPGEHYTPVMLVLGLALHRRGWRIVYLGADTPAEAFASAAAALDPARVVVGFAAPERAHGFDAPFQATIVCGDPLASAAAIDRAAS